MLFISAAVMIEWASGNFLSVHVEALETAPRKKLTYPNMIAFLNHGIIHFPDNRNAIMT